MPKKTPELNPFVQPMSGFHIPILYLYKSTPKLAGGVQIQVRPIDKTPRSEVFFGYKDDDRSLPSVLKWFPGLSTSAKDMFMYLLSRLQLDKDIIQIEETQYCRDMGVSHATYYKARKELINRVIIPRTSRRNTYWVNPNVMFRGSRIKKYPDLIYATNRNPVDFLPQDVEDKTEGKHPAIIDEYDELDG